MSYPPYPPDPNRPQDTPPPSNFPTYGRQDQPAQQQNPATPFVPPSSPVQGPPYQGAPYQGQQQNPQYQVPPQGPQYPGPQYPPQYGNGYGYGYPGVQQVKTNGLATAALVCGLVSIFFWIIAPVAIGLGIAALVQIKRRHESGTAQAVVGLSIGSVVSLVGAVVLVFMFALDWTGSEQDYGSDEPVASYSATPDHVYVDDLIVGECFDDGSEEGAVVRQPCPESHDAELISNVTLPSGVYPGDAKVEESARVACRREFTKYIGISPDKSERKSVFWGPDEELWNDGDRIVVCAAYATGGDQLRGSVKGTRR
ncbi:DUF4190 domain-containing protein [Kribbella qitaiheensis]|uniref:DUF4190 domain-containing protein n=1 Tax=Kribbella qitaiheensis TaxID=1544730 RepID=A0A7G6X280_9ACTN|nr:DUF4190 domain-containing protein [Kribbella qitaiheensis]QNE20345.1 DUF4190 domain-containing protein [Kribbella qitaiheensis]